ncbi:MAG: terpene cyclase/mutase family protein [Planctomycetes bacterium]|nr:terpene cyclase/mutase family protein [Planctomycetota bacterium]
MTHHYQPPFHTDESFGDLLLEQLRRAPWLLLSAAVHAVILATLLLFVGDRPEKARSEVAKVEMENSLPEEELIEPEIPPVEEPEIEETERVDPELDPTPDDHDETEDDQDWEENRGQEDFVSDKQMDSRSNNDAIGLLGGAGGPFGGDRGGRHKRRKGGGEERLNITVDRALTWLSQHQEADGSWDADGFPARGNPKLGPLCDGKGGALYDVGVSGLALLCFLGAGETQRSGPFKDTVARGLRWLKSQQDAEGCFGSRSVSNFAYSHAIATLAMVEAWGMTRSAYLEKSARQGVAFIEQCQNPYKAWRYKEADGQNDTSVTGWMVMALKSAKMAGIEFDERRLAWALDFIEEMTDEESGRTGYLRAGEVPVREAGMEGEFPGSESESLTAVAVLSRIFGGQDPAENRMVKLGAELLSKKLPVWDRARGSIDMYYWYYGTLAMFQVGGEHWRRWNAAMTSAVLETQRADGNFCGSWDPVGAWGQVGGRVYSTALMTLCLEVYYRYGRVFGTGR